MECHGRQRRALFECPPLDRLDRWGYVDASERCAHAKCVPPNLLQPIVEDHGRQRRALLECPILNNLDRGGYVDALERCALVKCPPPNLLQSIVENTVSNLDRYTNALSLIALTDGWTLTRITSSGIISPSRPS